MEPTFDVKDLDNMKRVQLQKLCKSVGIKANSKVRMPSGATIDWKCFYYLVGVDG